MKRSLVLCVGLVVIVNGFVRANQPLPAGGYAYPGRSVAYGIPQSAPQPASRPAWQPSTVAAPVSHRSHYFDPAIAGPEIAHEPPCTTCAPAPVSLTATHCVPCASGHFFLGSELLWMRAHFDQNVALIIDPVPGNTMIPFDYAADMSPRAWLGWQPQCGFGVRATYFQFDAIAATESATAVAGATPVYLFVYGAGGNLTRNGFADLGETLVSNHRTELRTFDLEATQRLHWNSLRGLLGVGLRFADMEQHLRGEVFNAGGGLEEIVTNDLAFEGVGPTFSVGLVQPIGDSHFSLAFRFRGSLLTSQTEQRIFEMKNAGANVVQDVADQRELLGNAEFGIGIQFATLLGPRSELFFQVGYESQLWLDVGGPVNSESTLALEGIAVATGIDF